MKNDSNTAAGSGLHDADCLRAMSNTLEIIRVEARILDVQISEAEDVYHSVKKLHEESIDKLARLRTQKRGLVAHANSIIANAEIVHPDKQQ